MLRCLRAVSGAQIVHDLDRTERVGHPSLGQPETSRGEGAPFPFGYTVEPPTFDYLASCVASAGLRRTTDEKRQVPGSLPYAMPPARS